MFKTLPYAIAVLLLAAHVAGAQTVTPVPAVATDEPAEIRNRSIVPPPSAKVATPQEEANKRIVMQWHYEFFDLGKFEEASNKYMAEDFQQNDTREPSGRANYIAAFKRNGYVPKKPEERPPILAVLADGDLVMSVIPEGWSSLKRSRNDEGPIHCNMYRVKNGKIVAMWVSGGSAPPAAK